MASRYTIEQELGLGAFGQVYAARDAETGELVALKRLARLSPGALSLFKKEFRAVQGLSHPHLVRLDALIEDESGWLIAMELVHGTELLDYLRDAGDAGRLRRAFSQLAEALAALHEHGVLHRDLKPANVRVTSDERVVLLDFGLVVGISDEAQSAHGRVAGTAAYMAPEQAAGRSLSAAADWYAFGVCLYEALAGSLPFEEGGALAVMMAKQSQLPEPPSARLGGPLPSDLEALCMALLARAPEARPGSDEVRRVLGVPAERATHLDRQDSFHGREAELAIIDAEHEKARSQGLRLLLVEGESGIGKSALVAEWLKRLRRDEPGALVLKSQCYENEHSAFKAFDAGMEALARRLNAALPASLPRHCATLPRLFPALAEVRGFKGAPLRDVPAEPLAALRAGLGALAELLEGLAEGAPLALVVDDLQWADAESFRLLRTLAERSTASRVLVLATIRPERELEGEIAAELALLGTRMKIERLSLLGLAQASCETLARSLLPTHVTTGWLERITRESKGHPLFISVLSRYAAHHRSSMVEQLSLDRALGERLEKLGEVSRGMLMALALAGVPCSVAVLSRALGASAEEVQKHAAELVSAKLLRRLPSQRFACFHDSVRKSTLARLADERRGELHRVLAAAIAAEPAHDPAHLALHLEGSGQWNLALAAHRVAGDGALDALAFGPAQYHYGRALALAGPDASLVLLTELRVKRGHALARGGKSALAAQQYLAACTDAEPALRIELRVCAAQQLLQSAQVEPGFAAAREVLAELGVSLPRSQAAALAHIAWARFRLAVSGLVLAEGAAGVSEQERARLDAMWRLSFPVIWIEMLAGASLSTSHLRRSLAAGEREHAARALAQEATLVTMQKPEAPEQAQKLLERARELFDAEGNAALAGWVLFNEGTTAYFRYEFGAAVAAFTAAETLLRVRCRDEPWLLTNVRSALSSAWWNRGELTPHLDEVGQWIAEAAERDDHFARSSLETLGFAAMRFLQQDQPDETRNKIHEVMAGWPRELFGFAHLGALAALFNEGMYRGGDAAWQELETSAGHERAFLLQASFGRAVLAWYRVQAALSAYAAAPHGSLAQRYLAVARSQAAKLRSSRVPFARRLNAPLVDAQLAAIDGDMSRALDRARAAQVEARRLGAGILESPLGYLEGLLAGGASGEAKRELAVALAATQGWRNPRRYVAMFCPVIDFLEARSQ